MLTLLPTPIGNLSDISFRTLRTFEDAQLIFCEDTRVTGQLLRHLEARFDFTRPQVPLVSFNEYNGKQRIETYAEAIKTQRTVFVSDAGMPAISDPGQLLVAFCQKEKIPYDVVPGPSAVTTLYAASGFESGRFCFEAFLPHKGAERQKKLEAIMKRSIDTVVYESPHRLIKLLEEICALDADRELFLAKELSKMYQHYYRDSVKMLYEMLSKETIRGEWGVVIRGKTVTENAALNTNDIERMDLPPKIKAKLLSRLTGESVKTLYERLGKKER